MNERDWHPAHSGAEKGPRTFFFPRVSGKMWLSNHLGFPRLPERGWFLESAFKADTQELRWEVGPLGEAPLEFAS